MYRLYAVIAIGILDGLEKPLVGIAAATTVEVAEQGILKDWEDEGYTVYKHTLKGYDVDSRLRELIRQVDAELNAPQKGHAK